jgi:hypothetical protein
MAARKRVQRDASVERMRELGRQRARAAAQRRVTAPFDGQELARLADLAAFMREAISLIDRCTDPTRGFVDRVDVKRAGALIKWGGRAPYAAFDLWTPHPRRPPKRSPGAVAAMLSEHRSQPDDDELIEHAVSYCERALKHVERDASIDGLCRTLRELVRRGLVARAQNKQAATAEDADWRAYLAGELPEGRRLGRKSAIASIAKVMNVDAKTVARACKRAEQPRTGAERGTTLAHREDMDAHLAALKAKRDAAVRAGRATLPHPR